MKRDLEVVRRIVTEVRAMPVGFVMLTMDEVDYPVFAEHVILMVEAGLLDANVQKFMSGEPPKVTITRLTWEGQNFADLIASDTIWNRVKSRVVGPGISWTFGIFTELLKQEAIKGFSPLG